MKSIIPIMLWHILIKLFIRIKPKKIKYKQMEGNNDKPRISKKDT